MVHHTTTTQESLVSFLSHCVFEFFLLLFFFTFLTLVKQMYISWPPLAPRLDTIQKSTHISFPTLSGTEALRTRTVWKHCLRTRSLIATRLQPVFRYTPVQALLLNLSWGDAPFFIYFTSFIISMKCLEYSDNLLFVECDLFSLYGFASVPIYTYIFCVLTWESRFVPQEILFWNGL